jgi:predicted DNA-binding transcriptional regulator YafY
MTPLESQFLSILHAHRGLKNALSVPAMAAKLGVSNRTAQEVKKTLVEHHGINIGSSCGKRSGWFLCENQAEVDTTLKQYRNRVKSLCVLIAKTTAAANLSGVMRQLALEFEQEEL